MPVGEESRLNVVAVPPNTSSYNYKLIPVVLGHYFPLYLVPFSYFLIYCVLCNFIKISTG